MPEEGVTNSCVIIDETVSCEDHEFTLLPVNSS